MNRERTNGATYFNNGGPMDTGYPALIADPPKKQSITKPPTVPCAEESEVPQVTITNSDPTGSPPTISQDS